MKRELHILLVEDSEDDALLLLRELQKCGYEPVVERVETRKEMDAAITSQDWDVILTDYIMPSFSGLDALQTMQEHGLDLPFIIVSGKIGEETAVDLMKARAHDYIVKGNLARLAPAIEREMQEAEVRRRRKDPRIRYGNHHEILFVLGLEEKGPGDTCQKGTSKCVKIEGCR